MRAPPVVRHWRSIFIIGIVLLATLVLWSAKELAGTVNTLRANELDNVGWNASQLEVQLVKLQHLLAEAKAGNPQRLLLQRRWDNLLSRIDPLDAAITPDLKASQPDFAPTFEEVKAGVAELQAYVRVRNGNLIQSVDVLEGPAAALAVPIRRLAVMGDQYWGQLTERRRGALVDKIQSLAFALGGLLLLLGANQIVIVGQRRRLMIMADALRQALQAADQANVAKTNFLARMSHELRTPLNAVIGFAEIMEHELFGPLGHPRYKDYSVGILASGRNL